MKTIANHKNQVGLKIQLAILILTIIALLSGISGSAGTIHNIPELPEEAYIDDIPFNTHDVAVGHFLALALAGTKLCEEAEIMDIPFNTAIIAGLNYKSAQQEKNSSMEIKFFNNLPEHLMARLVNLIKAMLVSSLILLGASIIGFLFFSYVY